MKKINKIYLVVQINFISFVRELIIIYPPKQKLNA